MFSEKIKLLMIKRNINGKELAEMLGCSPSNVYALLKKDNWSEKQLRCIAEALNCDLEASFILKDTNEKL